jgi:hypothetical protein
MGGLTISSRRSGRTYLGQPCDTISETIERERRESSSGCIWVDVKRAPSGMSSG